MAFEVGENSYIDIDFADDYHMLRGHSEWGELSASDKQSALVNATSWLDSKYALSWKGVASKFNQSLAWPRMAVWGLDGYYVNHREVPKAIKEATAEMAYKIAVEGDEPMADEDQGIDSEKVGPISISYTGQTTQKKYNHIRGLLTGLIKGTGGAEIVRA